jgi:hypothetical protein
LRIPACLQQCVKVQVGLILGISNTAQFSTPVLW